MKTHTFFLNTKALAMVIGALVMSAILTFVAGVAVGMGARPAVPAQLTALQMAAAGYVPAGSAAAAGSTSLAPSGGTPSATWPFDQKSALTAAADPAPAAVADPAAPAADVAAPKPAPADSAVRAPAPVRRSSSTTTAVSYSLSRPAPEPEPEMPDDNTAYTVQVGSFRSERNARALMARLETNGFRPSIAIRDEGGRPLHVVRIGRITGRVAAEHVAERIGDAERLVAVVTTDVRP